MARFIIEGREYEVPSLTTLTMGEAIVFYEYTDVTLDEIDEMQDGHPGLPAALAHIALARENPAAKKSVIRKRVESIGMVEFYDSFEDDAEAEGDALPPAGPQSGPPASPPSESESDASSGSDSDTSSAATPESSDPSSTGSPLSGGPESE